MIADYTGSQREAIKQAIANQAAVLDVGCGDGAKTHFISQYVKHSVGVDPDKKLIEFAKCKYPANNIEFHVGCAENLTVAKALFSAVLFNESLHHVPADRQTLALRESFRVLQAHGTLLIIEPIYASGSFAQIMELFSDEKVQKEQAIDAIEGVIDTEFALFSKKIIKIEYHCHGLDDLFQYSALPELDPHQSERFKKEALQRLERCAKNSQGDFILDYSATVWSLVKI